MADDSEENKFLASAFKSLTKLEFLCVCTQFRECPELSPSVRSSVLHLMHLSTLVSPELGVPCIHPHELIGCTLKNLNLIARPNPTDLVSPIVESPGRIQVEHLFTEYSGIHYVVAMLKILNPYGKSILNFDAIKKITISEETLDNVNIDELEEMFKHLPALESLCVSGM